MRSINELTFENISIIAETIINKFLSKEFDKVVLVYNQFKNAATQIIMNENYLPIDNSAEEKTQTADYILNLIKRNCKRVNSKIIKNTTL